MNTNIRIVYNKLLGGWYIVRGPHQTPLGGRFESRQAAKDHLERQDRLEREVEAEFMLGSYEPGVGRSVSRRADYLGEAAAERYADQALARGQGRELDALLLTPDRRKA